MRFPASFACRSVITFRDQTYVFLFLGRGKKKQNGERSKSLVISQLLQWSIQCAAMALLRKYLPIKTWANISSLFPGRPSLVQAPVTCGQTCLMRPGFPCGGCSKDFKHKKKTKKNFDLTLVPDSATFPTRQATLISRQTQNKRCCFFVCVCVVFILLCL